ncbi:fibrillin, partial [Candidatus Woesearchaeota archaeon CG_4_10_14_0_8_um_filter_47_5]
MKKTSFSGVYFQDKKRGKALYTRSLVPGVQVYGEQLVMDKGIEYREWLPYKSKLAAAILKGVSCTGMAKGDCVLYLGCSTGTTVSHVSDIVGEKGWVVGVDSAPRVMRDFVFFAEERRNVIPLLADANHPEKYPQGLPVFDCVYQDIAQRNQTEIFVKNLGRVKKGGYGLLCVKSRSIDVTAEPRRIYEGVRHELAAQL